MASIVPQQAHPLFFYIFFFIPPFSALLLELTMGLLQYPDFLSQWPAYLPSGRPTVCALFLLVTGGLVVACKTLTFLRVLLSLFVLPGKPVCTLLD